MAQTSSIEILPDVIKDKIATLREQHKTIDEIVAALDAIDVNVSRSAVGRYVKKMATVADTIRKSRELAKSINREFGDDNESRIARTNIEIMHSLLMKLMVGDDESEGVTLDPKDAMFLATSLEKLAKAGKTNLEEQIKAAEEIARKDALNKAADVVDKLSRQRGISKELGDDIRAQILGIK